MLYVKLFSWKQFYTQHWHLTWLLVPSYVHTIIIVIYITMQHAHQDRGRVIKIQMLCTYQCWRKTILHTALTLTCSYVFVVYITVQHAYQDQAGL
jgi:hypothetical protein